MPKVITRPTTAADLDRAGYTLAFRSRAVTALLGDEVLAIGGMAFLPGGKRLAFVNLTDEARRFPVTLHKTAVRFFEDARARGINSILAIADKTVEASDRWLERLGFRFLKEIEGKRVYQWRMNSSFSD